MDTSSLEKPKSALGRKGAAYLRSLIKNDLATPEAVQSVLNLFNPFPDDTVKPTGWPDGASAPSLPLVDTAVFSVVAPTGTTGTWNIHVCSSPWSAPSGTATTGSSWTAIGSVSPGALSPGSSFSPIEIKTYTDAGGDTGYPYYSAAASGSSLVSYDYQTILKSCPHRVVAQGIEVINTSAELYRGGMQYAYRYNPGALDLTYVQPPAGVLTGYLQSNFVLGSVPSSPTDIINYPNTFQSSAYNGCYCVNTPLAVDNDVTSFFPARGNVVTGGSRSAVLYNLDSFLTTSDRREWNLAGVFVTGLAPAASFTIRIRTYFELFPQPQLDADLLRLSKPPVPMSPQLMDLIASMLANLPAGCDYEENPFGEWFNTIMDTVGSLAPTIGGALSAINPALGLIGNGVGAAAKMARAANNPAPVASVQPVRKPASSVVKSGKAKKKKAK